MAGEVSQPHDHLFRSVFRDETEAASLLRAHLPDAICAAVRWSSLTWQPVTFIDHRLRDSESDLLYAVRLKAGDVPAWLYVLLEHQSTPDRWLRLRLLKYCCRIWERDRDRHPNEERLRPIVPLVWYQGERSWRFAREFSELFAPHVRDWPGVPRYAHLLFDQTEVAPDEVRGRLRGRVAQLAMMAAYRASWPALQRLLPLLVELGEAGAIEDLRQIAVYIAVTTRNAEDWTRFAAVVRQQVPGGAELMTKTEEMLEVVTRVKEQEARQKGRQEGELKGRQEGELKGRQEGELKGQVKTIEGLLRHAVPWSTIEAATGIDRTTFQRLKQQLDRDGANRAI